MSVAVKQAIISAAGYGGRLGEWGANNPKALLEVAGKPLIMHQLERMLRLGIEQVVVTVAHKSKALIDFLDSINLDLQVEISDEGQAPIGVLTGVVKALEQLPKQPFLLQSVDSIATEDYSLQLPSRVSALLYVYKSDAKPDFFVDDKTISFVSSASSTAVCYAGAGLYEPKFFALLADNFLQQIKQQSSKNINAHLLQSAPCNFNFIENL